MKLPPEIDPHLIEKRSEVAHFVAVRGMTIAEACNLVALDPRDFARHGHRVEPLDVFLPTPGEIKVGCAEIRRKLGLPVPESV